MAKEKKAAVKAKPKKRKSINSRAKGARGELELAHKWMELYGAHARRGQQFSGIEGRDVVVQDLVGIHIENKRVEALNLNKAMAQSVRDAKEGRIPVVTHKKNHGDWLIAVRLDDLRKFVGVMSEYFRLLEERKASEPTTEDSNVAG